MEGPVVESKSDAMSVPDLWPALVDDRDIKSDSDDRLGHKALATTLADLVASVETPSNIALYGAWGSGKSGIANLVKQRLAEKDQSKHRDEEKVGFVYFDAFKFADVSLRRNLIAEAAEALLPERAATRKRESLYGSTVRVDFKVPWGGLWRLFGFFMVAFLFVAALTFAGVAIAQGAFDAWPEKSAPEVLVGAAKFALVPASLLTALAGFAGRMFFKETRVEGARTDDEFETALKDVVTGSGKGRVVFFIDELDRCASSELVDTLTAIRTFFGVEGCVFVVAADPNVLERALLDSLEQATPVDTANPYYSAGTAYLDKVFQYQVTVPPLMPQSISAFAAALVAERKGVWATVDPGLVISILVPSHVRSPRRVKHLINTFVLTHRIAEQRAKDGILDVQVGSIITELAKLVCLQVEFPAFGRDMIREPMLPELVHEMAVRGEAERGVLRADQRYRFVTKRVWEIVDEYVAGERATDVILRGGSAESTTADGPLGDADEQAVIHTQGEQLLAYLARTKSVANPRQALIYMQSTGMLFGLSSEVADAVRRDASDANISRVLKIADKLEPVEQAGPVRLLLEALKASIGIERANVATTLVALVEQTPGLPAGLMDSIAIETVETLVPMLSTEGDSLDPRTAAGAWVLAGQSLSDSANRIQRAVLKSEASAEPLVYTRLVSDVSRALATDRAAFVDLISRLLCTDEPEVPLRIIVQANEDAAVAVLTAAGKEIAKRLEQALATGASPAAGIVTVRTPAAPAEPRAFEPERLIEELAAILATPEIGHSLREAVLDVMVRAASDETDAAIEAAEPNAPTARTSDTAERVLHRAATRPRSSWAGWIDLIDPRLLGVEGPVAVSVRDLVASYFDLEFGSSDVVSRPQEASVLDAFQTLLVLAPPAVLEPVATAACALDVGPFDSSVAYAALVERLRLVQEFQRRGLVTQERVAEEFAISLRAFLATELDQQPTEADLTEGLLVLVDTSRRLVDGLDLRALSGIPEELFEAISSCSWLDPIDNARARARLIRLWLPLQIARESRYPRSADLLPSGHDLSVEAQWSAVCDWLHFTGQTPSSVLRVMRRGVISGSRTSLVTAVRYWIGHLSANNHLAILADICGQEAEPVGTDSMLAALFSGRASQRRVLEVLVERFERATNNTDRAYVLRLWSQAAITDAAVVALGVDKVLIPMVGLGGTATDHVVKALPATTASAPPAAGRRLAEAVLRAASGNKDRRKRAESTLSALGFIEPKRQTARRKRAS